MSVLPLWLLSSRVPACHPDKNSIIVPCVPWGQVPALGEGSAGCQDCSQLGTAQVPGIKPINRLSLSVSWGW